MWIFAGFLVVGFFVFTYSWYTRTGSAINQHPYADLDHNSGPERPSELAHDITQDDVRNWERGVAGHHRQHGSGDAYAVASDASSDPNRVFISRGRARRGHLRKRAG